MGRDNDERPILERLTHGSEWQPMRGLQELAGRHRQRSGAAHGLGLLDAHAEREGRGDWLTCSGEARFVSTIEYSLIPAFGAVRLSELKRVQIRAWHTKQTSRKRQANLDLESYARRSISRSAMK